MPQGAKVHQITKVFCKVLLLAILGYVGINGTGALGALERARDGGEPVPLPAWMKRVTGFDTTLE